MHVFINYALIVGKMHRWVVRDSLDLRTQFESSHVFTDYALMVAKMYYEVL